MAKDREIEGTPAEATWAMLTVLIIIVVVLVFCCLLPFYRALEKRWHHWDDLGNDPRWDVENFQFSPTSPQLSRDPKYNRLSVCSTDNGSSLGTSSSGVNRGDSFRNTCILPRFPDQVEFRLPPSYDDLFSKGPEVEEDGTPPPYSVTSTTDTEELINEKDTEEIPMPALAPQAKKMYKKPQSKSSVPTATPPVATNSLTTQQQTQSVSQAKNMYKKPQSNSSVPTATPPVATNSPTTQQQIQSVSAAQDKKVNNKAPASSTPATMNKNSNISAPKQAPGRTATKSVTKTETIAIALAKTNTKNVQPIITKISSQQPAPPKKTNSKIVTKPTTLAVTSQPTDSQPTPAAPAPPVKKTYKKIKKPVSSDEK